jgi:hypothetical protein
MNEAEKAAKLAGELLEDFSGGKPILLRRTDGIFVADIAADLDRLGQFMRMYWKFDDFPCLVDEYGPLPIDLSTFGPIFSFMKMSSATPLFAFSEAFTDLKFEGVAVGKIKQILYKRVTQFLTVRYSIDEDESPMRRFASLGAAHSGFGNGPTGYLSFQVQTRLNGLRVHYSPSYLIDWSNVFGSPTTPVDGWIRPGRYKFGAMKQDGTFVIDNANFDIPPLSAASLSF